MRLKTRQYLRDANAVHYHRHIHIRKVRTSSGKVRLKRYVHMKTIRRRGANGKLRIIRRPHLIRHRHKGSA